MGIRIIQEGFIRFLLVLLLIYPFKSSFSQEKVTHKQNLFVNTLPVLLLIEGSPFINIFYERHMIRNQSLVLGVHYWPDVNSFFYHNTMSLGLTGEWRFYRKLKPKLSSSYFAPYTRINFNSPEDLSHFVHSTYITHNERWTIFSLGAMFGKQKITKSGIVVGAFTGLGFRFGGILWGNSLPYQEYRDKGYEFRIGLTLGFALSR